MPQTAQLWWYILLIGVIGVGAMLLGTLVACLVRRRLQSPPSSQAFTVQDLREMRLRGEITDQEYEAMRVATIARVSRSASPEGQEPAPSDPDVQGQQPDVASDPSAGEDPKHP
jgi:hypothetical protein